MTEKEQRSPLEPSFKLVDSYFAIPPEDRNDVLVGLMIAAKYAPTADEAYVARQRGNIAEIPMEDPYDILADAYATLIDGNFKPGGLNNESKTEEYRGNFYQMIRPLKAEHIAIAVQAILLRDAEK